MLSCRGLWNLGDIEVDRVATANIQNLTAREHNPEPLDPAPGRSVHEASGSARITGNGAAHERHRFGRIGWIKLPAKPGSSMKFVQCDSGTHDGLAGSNIQSAELLHRDEPAALGDSAACQAAPTPGDCDGCLLAARIGELRQEFRFVFGHANALSITFG